MRRLIVIFVFVMLVISLADAQILQPVKWKFSTKQVSNTEVELIAQAAIQKGWHLYGQYFEDGGPIRLSFTFKPGEQYELIGKVIESPKPTTERDEIFGIDVQYFSGAATFTQKIKVKSAKDFTINMILEGQACQDDGMCVPLDEEYAFNIKGATIKVSNTTTGNNVIITNSQTDTSISMVTDTLPESKSSADSVVEESLVEESVIKETHTSPLDGSLMTLFWFSFIAGLAAILTPCVFPMIPMTVSFFMNNSKSKLQARLQALFYGFSIIFIYTVIGTLVAVTLGANFANWLSTHWLPNVLFFIIFVVFAASFFGMFEITLPSWMINKADSAADKGGFSGAFFMAFTLVLVSFSCTGPIVGAILVQSAAGDVIEPIIGMFGFSLAFALPFTLFALFPQWLNALPKSGGWLNSVKVVLGFIELALGLKFLSVADQTYHWGLLDREIYLAIWIVIFTLMGLYLLGKIKFAHDSDVKHISVPRLFLVLVTFTFVVYLIPGMFGAPLKALSGYLPPMAGHDFDMTAIVRQNAHTTANFSDNNKSLCDKPKYAEFLHLPHGLQGYFDYEQGMACAKKLNKPVFIDFTGHGCVNCREMEANVWSDPRVLQRLNEEYVVIALYVDDKTELPENEWITSRVDGKVKKTIGKKFADLQIERYKVNAQPYYVLLNTEGKELVAPRAYNLDVEEFIEFLDKGIENFKKNSQKN